MSAAPRTVAVVGGGLAGITAALDLAEAGVAVTLLERRPRLGGATHSFTRGGLEIDNGQHVYLRCCTAYRGLLERLGVAHLAPLQRRLDVPVLAPGGRLGRLTRDPLPAPVHLTRSLLRYPHLSLAERLRAVGAALALRGLSEDDPALDVQTFGGWLAAHGQRRAAVDRFWDVVTRATLNAAPDDASLALAVKVFRTGLLSRADAADIGYAHVPLSRLHGDAALDALRRAGVSVQTGVAVSRLDELDADAVVLAVPHDAAAALLPDDGEPRPPVLRSLGTSPILNLHVRYDRPVTEHPFLAAVGSPVQWVFDRTAIAGVGEGQYLAVSLSAADDDIDRPVAELRAAYLPALAELFPAAGGAAVIDFFVTRERAATFRQAPGTRALRPGPLTSTAGVVLAGAWTATGWPATMEGAVRSGQAAVHALLAGPRASRDRAAVAS